MKKWFLKLNMVFVVICVVLFAGAVFAEGINSFEEALERILSTATYTEEKGDFGIYPIIIYQKNALEGSNFSYKVEKGKIVITRGNETIEYAIGIGGTKEDQLFFPETSKEYTDTTNYSISYEGAIEYQNGELAEYASVQRIADVFVAGQSKIAQQQKTKIVVVSGNFDVYVPTILKEYSVKKGKSEGTFLANTQETENELETTEEETNEGNANQEDHYIEFQVSETGNYYIHLYDSQGNEIIPERMNDRPIDFLYRYKDGVFETDSGTDETFTAWSMKGRTVAYLTAGDIYAVRTSDFAGKIEVEKAETTTISETANEAAGEGKTIFEQIETIMSRFCMSLATCINWLVGNSVGRNYTMDDIVFNEFPEARLDFFYTDIEGNEITNTSDLVSDLREPMTKVYTIFKNIVLVGFLIILVYVGIKIMLNSTAEKKATYKTTFTAWVTGIIILFFMPYFMKYTIALNDAFVTYMATSEQLRSEQARYAEAAEFRQVEGGFLATKFEEEKDEEGNIIQKGLFDDGVSKRENEDYMTTVRRLANQEEKIGLAIAYLVLSWQVLMLVIYYYKRAFIVALLIMIFPLVAFSYVWDKLNDGKSQALSAWTKEFTINVFVQSFHAIIFVFVSNAIYATVTNNSADFVLLIIASSFLFLGEEIMKKMFGGGGDSLGNATQTAMRVAVISRSLVNMGKRTIHNTVGREGLLRTAGRAGAGMVKGDVLLIRNAFQDVATNVVATARQNLLLPAEGIITEKIRETAQVIDTFKNWKNMSPQDLATAFTNYEKLKKARNGEGINPMTEEEKQHFDKMIKSSKIPFEKIEKTLAEGTVAYAAIGGVTGLERDRKVHEITQKLRLEFEQNIFPTHDKKGNLLKGKENARADRYLEAGLISIAQGASATSVTKEEVEKAWDDSVKKVIDMRDNIRFATNNNEITDKDNVWDYEAVKKQRKAIREQRTKIRQKILEDYEEVTGIPANTKTHLLFAENVAVLSQAKEGVVSASTLVKATQTLSENPELANALLSFSNVGTDLETFQYLLADKINNTPKAKAGKRDPLVDTRMLMGIDDSVGSENEFAYELAAEKAIAGETTKITAARQWAAKTVQEMNETVKSNGIDNIQVGNPVIRIQEIIYAAQQQSGHDVETVDDLRDTHLDEIILNKKRKLATLQNENAYLRRMIDGHYEVFVPAETEVTSRKVKETTRKENSANYILQYYSSDTGKETSEPIYQTVAEAIATLEPMVKDGDIEVKPSRRALEVLKNHEALATRLFEYSDFAGTGLDVQQIMTRFRNSYHEAGDLLANRWELEENTTTQKRQEFGEEALEAEGYTRRRILNRGNVREGTIRDRLGAVASHVGQNVTYGINRLTEDEKDYEQPTYNGYTEKDIKKLVNDDALTFVSSVIGLASETVVNPVMTVMGASIGAALTEDGIPIEEALTGGLAGYTTGTQVADKGVAGIFQDKKRLAERNQILAKAKKRVATQEKAIEKFREDYMKEAEEAAGGLDGTLQLYGASAKLTIEADGKLTAQVTVRADNAEYVSLEESLGAGAWQSFSEHVNYEFHDTDPSKDHQLYIYVRDKDGNVKGLLLKDIKLT